MSSATQVPVAVPSFYDDSKCGTLFKPDLQLAASAGEQLARDHNIPPSSTDKNNVILSIIDAQVDFTNPDIGNLFVPGAVEDTQRLSRFIFNNVASINHVLASLDTHYLYQPFHPFNWIAGSNGAPRAAGPQKGHPYQEGEHPDPFTIITSNDLSTDTWRPARLTKRMRMMLDKLETGSKKQLCIWPLHCILGTPGHALDPALMEAIYYHAGARGNQYDLTEKGMSQSAEHYGILQAEAVFDDDPLTALNMRIINKWKDADRIYFAGQAKSHCVLETLNQVAEIFTQQGLKEVLERLRVLVDCTSSVPDIVDDNGHVIVPFNKIAKDRFKELEAFGIQFVKSTDPVTV